MVGCHSSSLICLTYVSHETKYIIIKYLLKDFLFVLVGLDVRWMDTAIELLVILIFQRKKVTSVQFYRAWNWCRCYFPLMKPLYAIYREVGRFDEETAVYLSTVNSSKCKAKIMQTPKTIACKSNGIIRFLFLFISFASFFLNLGTTIKYLHWALSLSRSRQESSFFSDRLQQMRTTL